MRRRDSVTAMCCASRVAAAPVRFKKLPTRPLRTSSSCSLLGCVLAGSFARNASAQTSTGSIRGYVTDSSGTPVAGARVVAVNPLTSTQREVTTQSNGFYAMLGLVPAEYEVTARQIGMAPQKLRVRVLIGEVYPLDFKLGTSAIQIEAVTIQEAARVQTRPDAVATHITQQQINNLPSSSRNFL